MDANDDKHVESNLTDVKDSIAQPQTDEYSKPVLPSRHHTTSFESNEQNWETQSLSRDVSLLENKAGVHYHENHQHDNVFPQNIPHVSTHSQQQYPYDPQNTRVYNSAIDANGSYQNPTQTPTYNPSMDTDGSYYHQLNTHKNASHYYDQGMVNSGYQWYYSGSNQHPTPQMENVDASDTRSIQSEYNPHNYGSGGGGYTGGGGYMTQQYDPQWMNVRGNNNYYGMQPTSTAVANPGVNYQVPTNTPNPVQPMYSNPNNNNMMMVPAIPNQVNVMNSMVNDFNKWMISYKAWMENHMKNKEKMNTKKSHRSKSRRRHSKGSISSKYVQNFDDSIRVNQPQLNSSMKETSSLAGIKKQTKISKKRREHPYFEYQRCLATIANVDGSLVVVSNQYYYNDYLKHYIYTYHNILEQQGGNFYGSHSTTPYPGPLSKNISTNNKPLLKFISNKIDQLIPHREESESIFGKILLWKLMQNLVNNKGVLDYAELSELFMSKDEFNKLITSYSHTFIPNNPNQTLTIFNDYQYTSNSTEDHLKNLAEVFMAQKLWSCAFSVVHSNENLRQFVLTKFVNGLGALNPITTLICFLNGIKIPFISVDAEDFKRNYRGHLVAVLVNAQSNAKFAKLTFESFAERFYSFGMVLLTHFCFLIADVVPNVSDEIDKFSLIGLEPLSLATNDQLDDHIYEDAVILTEIYEYTKQLVDDRFVLVSLIPLKFTLANMLFERGLNETAYYYCEVVSKFLIHHPTLFSKKFIYDVFKFSTHLHLYLSSNLIISEQRSDWLDVLSQLVQSITTLKSCTPLTNTNATSYNTMNSDAPFGKNNSVKDSGTNSDQFIRRTETEIHQPTDINNNPSITALSSPNQPKTDSGLPIQNSNVRDDQADPVIQNSNASHLQNIQNQPAPPPQKMFDNEPPPVVFFNASNQQSINILPPLPPLSVANSENSLPTNPSSTPNSKKDDFSSQSVIDMKNHNSPISEIKNPKKPEDSAPVTPSSKNVGMFGGLFSKFLPARNQVYLPDDTEPTHVYDEALQKWVDIKKDPNENDRDYSEAPPMIPMNRTNVTESNNSLGNITVASTPSTSRERLKNRYVAPNI